MDTFTPSHTDVQRKWFVVDLEGKTLGRAASRIASILIGKHKATYTPNIDVGDFVVVLNADKFAVTGNKMVDKYYVRHSGYPGGFKKVQLKEMMKVHPERAIFLAVRGMLPKNKLRDVRMKRLKVYCSATHPHQAQQPESLTI